MKKLCLILIVFSFAMIYAQNKVYIWQNNVVIDSMDITSSLHLSFRPSQDTAQGGLLAYFPFNGNATDASGRGNDAAVHGALLTNDRFGNPNSAFKFSNGAYIDVPRSTLLEPTLGLTCAVWVRPDSALAWGTILTKRYAEDSSPFNSYFVGKTPSSNKWSFYTSVNHTIYDSADTKPLVWTFLTCTWDGSKNIMYVNGVKAAEIANAEAIPYSTLSLRIGTARLDGILHIQEQAFNGVIDDVRLYNRAIIPEEINALYHEGGWTGN